MYYTKKNPENTETKDQTSRHLPKISFSSNHTNKLAIVISAPILGHIFESNKLDGVGLLYLATNAIYQTTKLVGPSDC